MKDTHFAQRCRERGIQDTDPSVLWRALVAGVAGDDRALGLLEKVMQTPRGPEEIWRFKVSEGIFYAVIGPEGKPRTVLTQAMLKAKKFAMKRKRQRKSIRRYTHG